MRFQNRAVWFVGVWLSGSAVAAAPAHYRVVDLGTLGGRVTYGVALDDSGRVVGSSGDSYGRSRAFKTDGIRPLRASDMLPMPPGDGLPGVPEHSAATGIAQDGTVVGFTTDARGGDWPWLWLPDGRTLSGAAGSGRFLGVTPQGDATGFVYHYSSVASSMVTTPYVRRADGSSSTLLGYEGNSRAVGIAGPGTVMVGVFLVSPGATGRAFVWQGGPTAQDLGLFGGPGYKRGTAISPTGRWAGSTGPSYQGVAFTAPRFDAPATELPRPTGATRSEVRGIDALDRLVGWVAAATNSGVPKATYWHISPQGTEVVDLNSRVSGYPGLLMEAVAINSEGAILVDTLSPHDNRSVVLVPERLSLTAPAQVATGTPAEFTIAGCEPGARVHVYRSLTPPIPGRGALYRAAGIRWDINAPDAFGGETLADASGVARVRVNVTVAANTTIYLQAIQRGNKSNVISVTPVIRPVTVPNVRLPDGLMLQPQVSPKLQPQLTVPIKAKP